MFEGTLEITTTLLPKGCSVACRICPQELLVSQYADETRKMSFESFVKILSKVPKSYRIDFSGYAEPFLNRECSKMMLHAHKSGYKIACYTTLVGVSEEDLDVLASIPFGVENPLHIHVPDKNGVMPIKITTKYKSILQSFINRRIPHSSYMTMDPGGSPHPEIEPLVRGLLGRFTQVSRAGNVEESVEIRKRGRLRCDPMPRMNHNVLLPNGDVQLCCQDYGLKHTLGNLNEVGHDELFKGDEFARVLREMSSSDYNDSDILCRTCEYAKQC